MWGVWCVELLGPFSHLVPWWSSDHPFLGVLFLSGASLFLTIFLNSFFEKELCAVWEYVLCVPAVGRRGSWCCVCALTSNPEQIRNFKRSSKNSFEREKRSNGRSAGRGRRHSVGSKFAKKKLASWGIIWSWSWGLNLYKWFILVQRCTTRPPAIARWKIVLW